MIQKVITSTDTIMALDATPEGLWIGHQGGLTFFQPETGESVSWTTADGLPAHPVSHIAHAGSRLVVATPNGVAWLDDSPAAVRAALNGKPVRWQRALALPSGDGVHVNGVSLVQGRIHATTGGGRIYSETDGQFQLIELPLQQARLLRVLALPCAEGQRRLLIVTNNSGVLLLATGEGESPSLYQWGEDEGLISRYVTAAVATDRYVLLGVHGGMHCTCTQTLVERPDTLARWNRVPLGGTPGPPEQKRVHDIEAVGDLFYAGTSAGLYRLQPSSLAEGEEGSGDCILTARRIEEAPVRHLVERNEELWAVRNNQLGHFLDGSSSAVPAESHSSVGGGRDRFDVEQAPIMRFGRKWRFEPETRWRSVDAAPQCRQIVTVCSTEQGLAVGCEGGRFALMQGTRWTTESVARLRRPPEVQSVILDPDSGNFWATMRHGLFQRLGTNRWTRDVAFPARNVHVLQVWNGNVLALGNNGLYEYAQGAWTPVLVDGDSPALSVAAVGDDTLALVDRAGSCLYLWDALEPRPRRRAAAIGRANCMAWDAQRLWIGTDRGLLRWENDRLDRFVWDHDAENRIAALVLHQGTLLVGSANGVWHAPARTLDGSPRDTMESLGERSGLLDGLPHLQVTSMTVHEGDVWVGTQSGLAVLG